MRIISILQGFSLVACCAVLFLATVGGAVQPCVEVPLPGVKDIFGMSASSDGATLAFYGSREPVDGEVAIGRPYWIELDGPKPVVHHLEEEATNPPVPVWTPDGHSFFVVTEDGIVELNPTSQVRSLVWKGSAEGLAISQKGGRLAFWNRIRSPTRSLVVYDVTGRKPLRVWQIPLRYGGDLEGWDLAFSRDDRSVFARTFDADSVTPLKRFDLATGMTTVIAQDCYSLLANRAGTVYYIGAEGDHTNIFKIGPDGSPVLLPSSSGLGSISGTGSRWLIARKSGSADKVTIDTETDQMKPLSTQGAVVELSDGRFAVARSGKVTIGGQQCALTK